MLSKYFGFVSIFRLKVAGKSSVTIYVTILHTFDLFPMVRVVLSLRLLKSFVGMSLRGAMDFALSVISLFLFLPQLFLLTLQRHPVDGMPRFCEDPVTVSIWTEMAVALASHSKRGLWGKAGLWWEGERRQRELGQWLAHWHSGTWGCLPSLCSLNRCDKIIHVSL